MAVLLALSLALTTALDPTPDVAIPPPYAPPADEMPADDAPAPEVEAPAEQPEEVVPTVPTLPGPRGYLYQNYPGQAPVLDCIIRLESTWYAGARSGPYLGLAQFDYGTWMETPQGKRGLSRTDPYASIDALAWGVVHLGYGRWPNTSRRCR